MLNLHKWPNAQTFTRRHKLKFILYLKKGGCLLKEINYLVLNVSAMQLKNKRTICWETQLFLCLQCWECPLHIYIVHRHTQWLTCVNCYTHSSPKERYLKAVVKAHSWAVTSPESDGKTHVKISDFFCLLKANAHMLRHNVPLYSAHA